MPKVIVYHSYYGCDTGCCGHTVQIMYDAGTTINQFEFAHPYDEDHIQFAKGLVTSVYGQEHVQDLDWESSIILDD